MPQVSKNRVAKDVEKRMFEVFWESVSGLKNSSAVEEFFSELLTPTEKIMLAKRLSIAVLLLKGYDYRDISSILKVSYATISRVSGWLKYSGEGYKKVVEKMLKKEAWREFLEGIEKVFFDLHPQKRHPSEFRKKKVF